MAYHADYWMLAGITSPIVALAAIVAAALTLAALNEARRLSARVIKAVTYFMCLVNVALQVVIAQAALTSLATSRDAEPMHATTDHVVTGLGLLFATFIGRMLAEACKAPRRARGKDSAPPPMSPGRNQRPPDAGRPGLAS